jgi:hypothetical protein
MTVLTMNATPLRIVLVLILGLAGCGGSDTGAACGDGLRESGEACDGADLGGESCGTRGFPGGTLACAPDCTFDESGCAPLASCGNGARDGGEACDGADLGGESCGTRGFPGGTLACAPDCTFDESGCAPLASCGNGARDGGEACDGADLGGESCGTRGFPGGTLACAPDCTFDESGCAPLPSCGNGVQDAEESDVDCGGPVCDPCRDGARCRTDADCGSGDCAGGRCDPACRDYYGQCLETFGLFGQPDYRRTAQGRITGHTAYHSSGLAMDLSVRPNILYAVDSGHSRILAFRGLGTCALDVAVRCTNDTDCADGDICVLTGTQDADLVLGQPDLTSGECNGDNNFGWLRPPTASTLCLADYPGNTNVAEQWRHTNLDVDAQGNLYVVDVYNNRILRYNQPFSDDRSEGRGDTVADFVWGQPDFETNGVNRGNGPDVPSADSVHVSWYPPLARGVSVDAEGHVWVADQGNNRVLRFPLGSSTADLVLGQPDFSTKTDGDCDCGVLEPGASSGTPVRDTRLCRPTLARLNPENGAVYVIDECSGPFGSSRILRFDPPFDNGMAAAWQIRPRFEQNLRPSDVPYHFSPTGFVFNPLAEGPYAAGILWVNEMYPGGRTLLLDEDGNVLEVAGSRGFDEAGGQPQWDWFGYCREIDHGDIVNWPSGSPAFDNAGNLYVADELWQHFDVRRVPLPFEPVAVERPDGGERTCLPPSPRVALGRNPRPAETFNESVGVLAVGGQLLAKDWGLLKVWDDYAYRPHGAAPDFSIPLPGAYAQLTVDDRNRLWLWEGWGPIRVYQLPITEETLEPISPPGGVRIHWGDDGTEIPEYFMGGLVFHPETQTLWMSDWKGHRVFRFSDYDDFATGIHVDLVIGQPAKDVVGCNHDQAMEWIATGQPSASSLCDPRELRFDRLGNLYVVESDCECHGNNRVTVFMAPDIPVRPAPGQPIGTADIFPADPVAARKVFIADSLTSGDGTWTTVCEPVAGQRTTPMHLAFDAANRMVLGLDGYFGFGDVRHVQQLWLYEDPLREVDGEFVQDQAPDYFVNVPVGSTGGLCFDDDDRLVFQDSTWTRVWIIDLAETNDDGEPVWLVRPEIEFH